MTRARNNAEARTTRARKDAGARATTRARTAADERPNRPRVASSVRLQICANVFARSRIHFDASRWASARVAANDVAAARAHERADPDDDTCQPATPQGRGNEFTLH